MSRTGWISAVAGTVALWSLVSAAPPVFDYTGLRVGNRWEYTGGNSVTIDRVDSTIEGWKFRRLAMIKCTQCNDSSRPAVSDTSYALVRGDSVFQMGPESGGNWELAVLLPPVAGKLWVTDSVEHDTLQWIAQATIRVPAGKFTKAWRIRGNDSLQLWVHQDAGLVRMQHQGDLIELLSFQRGE